MRKSFFYIFFVLGALFTSNCYTETTVAKDNEYWGYHLILDCTDCDKEVITSKEKLKEFIENLVDAIEMKAYGEPNIVWFGSGKTTGYSLIQLIETSSITGHFVDATGEAYLDIFSCKLFDTEIAKQVIRKYFKPAKIKTVYLTRQA